MKLKRNPFIFKTQYSHILYLVFLFLCSQKIIAQSADAELATKDAYTLKTPLAPIYLHYHYTEFDKKENLDTAARALDPYVSITSVQRRKLAKQLREIYDAKGFILNISALPTGEYYTDTSSKTHTYIPFAEIPEIYVVKHKTQKLWYYSKETIKAIPIIHRQLFPFHSDKLLDLFPKYFSNTKFLGISLRDLILVILLAFCSWLLYKLLTFVLYYPTKFFLRKFKKESFRKRDAKKIDRPLSLLMICKLLSNIIAIFHFPALLTYIILVGISVAIPIFSMFWLFRVIETIGSYLQDKLAAKRKYKQKQIVPFVQSVLKVIIIIVGIIYILKGLGVNVTAILAGLSIGGIAFALAAQDTIKNLFGSITILLDSPFQINDWIVTEEIDGIVEQIGFRSTRLRSFDDSVIYVPNGRMADFTINNMGLRVYRRFKTTIGITYDTPVPLIKAFLKGTREIVLNHSDTRKDFFGINMNDFGASSLNIMFNIFLISSDFISEWRIREDIILQIIELADDLGVRFAFPTQTVHIEEMPEKTSLTPTYDDLSDKKLDEKINDFISARYK